VPEFGVALPNAGASPSAQELERVAAAAADHGFDFVAVADHVIVGASAPDDYANVLDPYGVLAWVGARHERLGLLTSVIVVPMHNPIELAQRGAALELLSGGRFRFGVGVGWNEDEYRLLGQDFATRGRRMDEALRLIRALWAGERTFEGEFYAFRDARQGPQPESEPTIWVGGNGAAARRRALEHGGLWHPNAAGAEDIARIKQEQPELRVVPRTRIRLDQSEGSGLVGSPHDVGEQARALLDAGCDGFLATFVAAPGRDRVEDVALFAETVLPGLRA
jgi:probable F420-dependent oxidoreductase